MKMLKIWVLLAALLLSLSCTDKTVNQITQILPLTHTVGAVYQYEDSYLDTVFAGCFASVYNVKSYPAVTLNGDTLQSNLDYSYFYKEGLTLFSGQNYTMKVDDQGNVSQATIVQPTPLVVISPNTFYICMYPGDPLALSWNQSQAQWYLVRFYWVVEWYDTLNFVYAYTYFDTLLATNDTSYTFSSSRLWVPPAGSNWIASYWDGDFYFGAASGPKPLAGSPGNFTGSGTGFLLGLYLTSWYDVNPCFIGLSADGEEKIYDRPDREILKTLFHRLRPQLP